jgi:hypothetical protein
MRFLKLAPALAVLAVLAGCDGLRELVEQAAAYSGAADEQLISQRIAEQGAELERLKKQRDKLSQSKS